MRQRNIQKVSFYYVGAHEITSNKSGKGSLDKVFLTLLKMFAMRVCSHIIREYFNLSYMSGYKLTSPNVDPRIYVVCSIFKNRNFLYYILCVLTQ